MLNTIVRKSAIAVALIALAVPASSISAQSTTPPTPPKVVTGGDPQPMGEAMRVILTLRSLVVL